MSTFTSGSVPLSLCGSSADAARVRAALDAAAAGGPLLIVSEDGLDADAVARHLHERTRGTEPFISVDCAQPAMEIERLLFGGRQPARSTELERLPASAALATNGTVFLRHLTELPGPAQRRLARLLRDGEAAVGARGSVHPVPAVIASTSPNPEAAVREGQLRADLLRRFGSAPVVLPPLHTRQADFPEILRAAVVDACAGDGRPAPEFTQAAVTVLAALPWPGNLNELRRTIERILRNTPDGAVRQEDVLAALAVQGVAARIRPHVSLREARRRFEQDYIAAVLEEHHWRMSDAARTLGIERANLYRKARQLGITPRVPGKVADAR